MNAPAPKLPDPTGATPSPPPAAANPPAPTPPPGNAPPAATPPAAAPKDKGGSIYAAVGEPEPGAPGSSAWPSDWREQSVQAIGDPKAAKLLERFQSPVDMAKALVAAQQKIRSGEYKRAAPVGDNPEEIKAWREEQGIPDSPEGYEIPQIQGVDLASLDPVAKAGVDVLRQGLHKANLNKEQGATVAQAMLDLAASQTEAQAEADATRMDNVEDTLRAEWGPEYRKNLNMNGALLSQHFGDEMDDVLKARMPNGTRLADHPVFNKFLNAMARATGNDVMFDGDVAGGKSVDARIQEIKQIMETNINEYYAKGLDKEYAQLLEKQEARKR